MAGADNARECVVSVDGGKSTPLKSVYGGAIAVPLKAITESLPKEWRRESLLRRGLVWVVLMVR